MDSRLNYGCCRPSRPGRFLPEAYNKTGAGRAARHPVIAGQFFVRPTPADAVPEAAGNTEVTSNKPSPR